MRFLFLSFLSACLAAPAFIAPALAQTAWEKCMAQGLGSMSGGRQLECGAREQAVTEERKPQERKPQNANRAAEPRSPERKSQNANRPVAAQPKPDDASAFFDRAVAYHNKGDYDRAIAEFNEAIRLKPDHAAAFNGRGFAYFKKSEFKRAIADYDHALKLDAKTEGAANNRHDALKELEKVAAAQPLAPIAATAASQPPVQIAAKPEPVTRMELGRRVALVIGNSSYANVGKLTNPARDARAVAAVLTRLGFEVVTKYDLGAVEMRRALGAFEDKAAGADWALVYFAVHGIELGGRNWLIPVDAQLLRGSDVADEAVALDRVLERVRPAKQLRMVILDACRNNPFLSRMILNRTLTRSVERGLATIEPDHGEVVFYAARHGSTASDGSGENSPFVAALVKHMEEDGLELGRFFRRVTSTVLNSTNPQQEPFVYGRIPDQDFYFKPPKG